MSTALLNDTDAATAPDDDTALAAATAARLERLAARRAEQSAPTATGAAPATKARRGAPSKETKLTALIASVATTGGLGFLLAPTGAASTAQSTIATTQVAFQSSAATVTASSSTAGATAAAATGTGTTINGAVEANRFGNVQVAATFSSTGALTSVTLLQQPGDNHSVRINSSAVPTLTAEALAAQSANINSVSGATYTSNSYTASLQAAIDTARAQGTTTLA